MIHTSYYAKYRGNAGCSISRTTPKGFKGLTCTALNPPAALLAWYKIHTKDLDTWYEENKTEGEEFIKRRRIIELQFTESYKEDILNRIDPASVAKGLEGKVLLCWEKSGRFCHRYIVAQWLIDNGFECKEMT